MTLARCSCSAQYAGSMRRPDASARCLCLEMKHVFASEVATGCLLETNES